MQANSTEAQIPAVSDESDEVSTETMPVKVDRHFKAKEMARYSDVSPKGPASENV